MYAIVLEEELAHNKDLLDVLGRSFEDQVRIQETLQLDLMSSLLRQMSETDAGDWRGKYAVEVRRLREREFVIGLNRVQLEAVGMRPLIVNRIHFVSNLIQARIEELEVRLDEVTWKHTSPNVFGNAPLWVIGKRGVFNESA